MPYHVNCRIYTKLVFFWYNFTELIKWQRCSICSIWVSWHSWLHRSSATWPCTASALARCPSSLPQRGPTTRAGGLGSGPRCKRCGSRLSACEVTRGITHIRFVPQRTTAVGVRSKGVVCVRVRLPALALTLRARLRVQPPVWRLAARHVPGT